MLPITKEKLSKYNKNISDNKTYQIIYYSCLVVIFICLFILFFLKTFITNEKPSLNYKENTTTDYTVKLKDNKYYETNILPSNMDYIASLIDSVNLKFNYTFTTNSDIDYHAKYYIEAITRVYGKDNKKVLYEKKETILPEEEINKKDVKAINFYKEVKIDYDHYNNFASSFKSSYLLNYDSDVTIILHVISNGKSPLFTQNIDTEGLSLVVIPLTEQTINITIDSKNINHASTITDNRILSNINYLYLVLLLIVVIILIYLIYKLIKIIIKNNKKHSEYDKKLKRILKDYDSVIANSINNIDEKDYKIIRLSSFEELIDVHDNISLPIIFKEVIKGKVSTFSIIDDKLLYKYTLDSKNLTKNGDNDAI